MFHLSGSKKEHWLTPFFIVILVVIAYIVGQIPLALIAMKQHVALDANEQLTMQLSQAIGENLFLILILLPFICALAAVLFSVKYIYRRPLLSVFTKRSTLDWKRILISFGSWFFIMFITFLVSYFKDGNIDFQLNAGNFLPLLLISIFLVPLQTTAEEVFFRGFLLQSVGPVLKRGILSILFTGILFGLVHGANPEVEALGKIALLYYIQTGIFLGLLTVLDDGLELSIGYHAANNIFACIIVTSDWQVFQTDALFINRNPAVFGWESYLTLFLLQPLLLVLFSKIFRWSNWKVKLLKEFK